MGAEGLEMDTRERTPHIAQASSPRGGGGPVPLAGAAAQRQPGPRRLQLRSRHTSPYHNCQPFCRASPGQASVGRAMPVTGHKAERTPRSVGQGPLFRGLRVSDRNTCVRRHTTRSDSVAGRQRRGHAAGWPCGRAWNLSGPRTQERTKLLHSPPDRGSDRWSAQSDRQFVRASSLVSGLCIV